MGEMKMKKIMIAAASLVFVTNAQANQPEYSLVEVDATPIVAQSVVVAKWDSRFGAYALENIAAGGQ
jgi:hypothetical protein